MSSPSPLRKCESDLWLLLTIHTVFGNTYDSDCLLASACIKMASYCTASLTSCVFPLFFGIHVHEGKWCPKKSIIYSQIIHPSSEFLFRRRIWEWLPNILRHIYTGKGKPCRRNCYSPPKSHRFAIGILSRCLADKLLQCRRWIAAFLNFGILKA